MNLQLITIRTDEDYYWSELNIFIDYHNSWVVAFSAYKSGSGYTHGYNFVDGAFLYNALQGVINNNFPTNISVNSIGDLGDIVNHVQFCDQYGLGYFGDLNSVMEHSTNVSVFFRDLGNTEIIRLTYLLERLVDLKTDNTDNVTNRLMIDGIITKILDSGYISTKVMKEWFDYEKRTNN